MSDYEKHARVLHEAALAAGTVEAHDDAEALFDASAFILGQQNTIDTLRAQLSEAQARLADIALHEPKGHTPDGAVLPMLKRLVRLGLDNGMTAEVRALSEIWDELHQLRDVAPVSPAAPSLNEPQHYCASCRYVGFTTSELECHGGTCPMCNDGDHIFEFTWWPPHVLPEASVSPAAQVAQGVADGVRAGDVAAKAIRMVADQWVADDVVMDGSARGHLQALVTALDNAFISSWQSTAYWNGELEAAREWLAAAQQQKEGKP